MRKIILILFILILSNIVYAEPNSYYEVNLEYKSGDLFLKNIEVKLNADKIGGGVGNYAATIISFSEDILNITFFEIPLTILYDNIDPETGEIVGGGLIELNETEIILRLPYYENAQEIIFYNPDLEEILVVDVSQFSKDYEKKEVLTPEEAEERRQVVEQDEKTLTNTLSDYWWVLLTILIVLIIILIYSLRKKK